MANRKVSLLRQCKTENGTWRRFPAVIGKNGRVKPNYVLVNGVEKEFKQGYYQLRSYAGSRTVIKNVGEHAADALVALDRETRLLSAREAAVSAGVQIMEEPDRLTLVRQLAKFVGIVKDRGSVVASKAYKLSADEFLLVSAKVYADQITSDDILQYHNVLRKRGSVARTVYNRHANLMAFLRYCGRDIHALAPVMPKYEKTMPEIYEEEHIKPFFASLRTDYHRLLFEVLLSTGLREQEAMHLEWVDISEKSKTLIVRSKPHWGFKVKDCEERSLPIPESLLSRLIEFRTARPKCKLVFGTAKDKPNTKMLRTLKRLVHRAGLNCDHCKSCLERNECELWFLHKFRATYITTLLRRGLDIRTVMQLSGHADLESVMRYLRPAEGDAVQAAVNSIAWV